MPNKMKVYDEAAENAGILRDCIVVEADRDGKRTACERQLIALADRVVAYSEATAACARVVIRFMGGGMVVGDRRLMGQVRDCDALLSGLGDYPPAPAVTMRFTVRRKREAPAVTEARRKADRG